MFNFWKAGATHRDVRDTSPGRPSSNGEILRNDDGLILLGSIAEFFAALERRRGELGLELLETTQADGRPGAGTLSPPRTR